MYVRKPRSLPHLQLWAMLLEQVCWLHLVATLLCTGLSLSFGCSYGVVGCAAGMTMSDIRSAEEHYLVTTCPGRDANVAASLKGLRSSRSEITSAVAGKTRKGKLSPDDPTCFDASRTHAAWAGHWQRLDSTTDADLRED